jgi:hypothetical protein
LSVFQEYNYALKKARYNKYRTEYTAHCALTKDVESDVQERLYRTEQVKYYSQTLYTDTRSESRCALTKDIESDVLEHLHRPERVLILFTNTFWRSAFESSLCSYKRYWK